MSKAFEEKKEYLKSHQHTWLVTGAAGFIGSHLTQFLLTHDQKVVGLDNFATGKRENLEDVKEEVSLEQWHNFTFHEVDICSYEDVEPLVQGVEYVLHQAALGSVPRSIEDPIRSNNVNVGGFLNVLRASERAKVEKFIYASSSSVYGSSPQLPKIEENIGDPLSPYAVTKYVNELYANVFPSLYSIKTVGLRYFNVFGPRQDPNGQYAAVIPRWIAALLEKKPCTIFGDGKTSRDFCFIENVVQANILSALTEIEDDRTPVFNVAVGDRTSLTELYMLLHDAVKEEFAPELELAPTYKDFREGDIAHSHADISFAKEVLHYAPSIKIADGAKETVRWYTEKEKENQ